MTDLNPQEARQGHTGDGVRWVLHTSLVLCILAGLVLGFVFFF